MQSRIDSVMEALTNILIGFAINTAMNLTLMPHVFGMAPTAGPLVEFAVLMTVVSFARSLLLRRLFNGRTVWEVLKASFTAERAVPAETPGDHVYRAIQARLKVEQLINRGQ